MGIKDNLAKIGVTKKEIYRGSSANLSLAISNSKIVEVNEKNGKILSRENSRDTAETFKPETLERGLKSRHAQLIAIGGAIGTGLFVGSSITLTTCGPASLFLSFILLGSVVYFVTTQLLAMTVFLPLPGNGPLAFINDFLSPSFGFCLGFNYFYAFAILVAAEVSVCSLIVGYWNDKISPAVWITIFLAVIIFSNFSPVHYFGEMEFVAASIKLIALTGLIILSIVLFFGGGPNQHGVLGFRYWKHSPFKEHLTKGSTGRFLGLWTAIIKSGFAYITSPELLSTTAGETVDPRRNGIKAARRFIFRLVFFYGAGSLAIGCIVSSTDKHLFGGASDASGSPFVVAIKNAGIPVLDHIINAVILTSALSAGNSFLYSASRTLFSMAQRGKAPRFFSNVNRFGVPYYSVGAASLFGFLAYLNVSSTSANVFNWLSNISTISGFIGWIAISFAFLRWRKAIAFHGLTDRIPYKPFGQPFGAWYVIVFMSLITITNGYAVFFDFNGADFVAAYITLPILVVLYCGHLIYSKLKNHSIAFLTPIEDIDLVTNLDLIEEEEQNYEVREPKNFLQKLWYWIA
ncbi:uncharacterized protein KGF55_003254 [Candida pseudojiufengensis]|uniref:uncharacterized protein n=1 Tax=Candida pseudojiufengensis TaxID=497109 RepID=UPI002223F49A|nr:uncharacterized protein KGF55_003254 [Candida pseudojiufengensis]KAI5962178.1 hypothetical protein KGF55_003254 [Candida pseudojiufengensis]